MRITNCFRVQEPSIQKESRITPFWDIAAPMSQIYPFNIEEGMDFVIKINLVQARGEERMEHLMTP